MLLFEKYTYFIVNKDTAYAFYSSHNFPQFRPILDKKFDVPVL